MMKIRYLLVIVCLLFSGGLSAQKTFKITKERLKDKIMGGWAGQTIGVTFGGPVEFRYNGTIVSEYHALPWYDGYLKKVMLESPGLYDDLYVELTFVDVFEKEGFDAPASSHAKAYANAGYVLWHANQAARYNILNGIMPPASGHWMNNPHADCIDYQIECDYSGLMSPGMPNAASAISDKIGHIMNYGDGYYGGVFLGACYSLAFVSDDLEYIVREALKTIPEESNYHKCISDVLKWHKMYPDDWKKTWFALQDKWTQDIGCPSCVFSPMNIDATINSAYVVLGLLYGKGDYTQTIEITTRCGQDADCNPSSAAGILGTVLGYSNIPAFWKLGLKEAEGIDFKYTTMSLSDVYEIGTRHALQNIERNGGKVGKEEVEIILQKPAVVPFEKSFEGLFPVDKHFPNKSLKDEYSFEFEGNGFVINGETAKWASESTYQFKAELFVDGQKVETASLPTSYRERRHELFWKYDLPQGKHKVTMKLLNPSDEHDCRITEVLLYSNSPNPEGYHNIYRFGQKILTPTAN